MDYAVLILVVGGAMLLIGATVVLLSKFLFRRAMPGVSLRDPAVFDRLAIFLSAMNLLLAVVYSLEGRIIWQGALHLVIAVLWIVIRRLNARGAKVRSARS